MFCVKLFRWSFCLVRRQHDWMWRAFPLVLLGKLKCSRPCCTSFVSSGWSLEMRALRRHARCRFTLVQRWLHLGMHDMHFARRSKTTFPLRFGTAPAEVSLSTWREQTIIRHSIRSPHQDNFRQRIAGRRRQE
jgi:hypothetical protein